jgi:NAD(P)-dependent dehydrogenase (short-subunit alcohol dehydrogenase family)
MAWSPDPAALRGRVAVVAGATRGAGRGIAAALGEAGATVVCTGRSTRTARSEYNRQETIEETAELVTGLGGVGIAAAVDHLHPDQVKTLAERIRKDYGRVDVLVNDIWGAELLKGGPADWNTPIWKHDLDKGLRILRLAIETHVITSHHLLPLLIDRPGGLLVEVTDGTAAYNASHYRISVFYDLAKVAVTRLAFSQGHELQPHGATAVAITPGWLRSEMMLEAFGVSEERWRDAIGRSAPPDFALSESPRYVGRAVVALASDPARARWNQQSVSSGQLAREYGFTDVDGSRPDIWRYMEEIRERGLEVLVHDVPRLNDSVPGSPRGDDARATGGGGAAPARGDPGAPRQHGARPLLASPGAVEPPARADGSAADGADVARVPARVPAVPAVAGRAAARCAPLGCRVRPA